MPEKFLIFGAGVLGSLYAARFAEAGYHVSILARGQRLQEIRSQGILLEHAFSGKRSAVPIHCVEALQPSDRYDYILVLVRKNQVRDALALVGAHTGTPTVMVMVNNPSGYQEWIEAVGGERLMAGFAGAGGWIENGVVRYALAPGFFQPTTLAELDGRETRRLKELAHAFRRAGFPTATCSNMDAWQKTHVAWINPLASAIYLAEKEGLPLSQTRPILGLTVDAIRESFRVLDALAVPVTPPMLKFWTNMPRIMLIEVLRLWSKTRHFETLALRHTLSARDEMRQVAAEFSSLSRLAGVQTPALENLGSTVYVGPLSG